MAKDCMHQTVQVNDWVVFNAPYVKGIDLGLVTGFTKKIIKIKYGKNFKEECNRFSSEVFVCTEQVKIAKLANPEMFI